MLKQETKIIIVDFKRKKKIKTFIVDNLTEKIIAFEDHRSLLDKLLDAQKANPISNK